MHHSRSREIRVTMAESEIRAEIGEPPAAPGPVREQWVGKSAHYEGRYDERRVLPALGNRAGHDGERGIHEDHLEQEQHHGEDVVGAAMHEEVAALSPQPEGLAKHVDDELAAEHRRTTQIRNRAD